MLSSQSTVAENPGLIAQPPGGRSPETQTQPCEMMWNGQLLDVNQLFAYLCLKSLYILLFLFIYFFAHSFVRFALLSAADFIFTSHVHPFYPSTIPESLKKGGCPKHWV